MTSPVRHALRHGSRSLLRAVGVAVLVLGSGCTQAPEPPQAAPPKVTVQHPEMRELVDYDRYTGWLRASATVEVRARVRGHIKEVHFTDGDMVKKGDLLFELDPRPFEAEVGRARDQLRVDEAQYEFAKAEATRDEELFSKKALAKSDLEKSLAARSTWEAKVAASKQEITRRELDIEYSRITAEISGKVGRAFLTKGNLVNAGGSDPLLTTIVAVDPIHVYFAVDEPALLRYRQARAASEGQAGAPGSEDEATKDEATKVNPAGAETEPSEKPENGADSKSANAAVPESVESPSNAAGTPNTRANPLKAAKIPFEFGLEIEKGYPHEGILDFADNQIQSGTGTIEVRGFAANADGALVPGSRVRIQLPTSAKYEAIVVPDVAVLSDQDQRYLLVVGSDNTVLRKTVTLGKLLPDGMRVILPSNDENHRLSRFDRVIVVGLQRARINDSVEPVDADGKPFPEAGE